MRIISGDPFGSSGLIEWYGEKNSTTFNSSTGRANLNNLNKINGIEWKDDSGNAYTRGTIITGTLTTSAQNPTLSNDNVEVSTGTFGSNGGQIAISCSAFCDYSDLFGAQSGQCPTPSPSNPTMTLKLYRVTSSTSETLVNSQSYTGTYSCSYDLESDTHVKTFQVDGSFIYYDNLNTTSNRNYKLVANVDGIPLYPLDRRSQSVSILTQEE
jgi:hypothetical protein